MIIAYLNGKPFWMRPDKDGNYSVTFKESITVKECRIVDINVKAITVAA